MKEGVLLFNMIQNWEEDYPEHGQYQVLELILKNNKRTSGYSFCNEYGYTNFLPTVNNAQRGDYYWFVAANNDVSDVFLGDKKIENGKTFLKVIFYPEIEPNLEQLFNELNNTGE